MHVHVCTCAYVRVFVYYNLWPNVRYKCTCGACICACVCEYVVHARTERVYVHVCVCVYCMHVLRVHDVTPSCSSHADGPRYKEHTLDPCAHVCADKLTCMSFGDLNQIQQLLIYAQWLRLRVGTRWLKTQSRWLQPWRECVCVSVRGNVHNKHQICIHTLVLCVCALVCVCHVCALHTYNSYS